LVDFHSPLWMLLVLWGIPLLMSSFFIIFLIFLKEKKNESDFLILLFLSLAWFLILVPEFVYVKDIYIHSYQRANTMFKLTYQSFAIFSLASGYIMVRSFIALKKKLIRNLVFGLWSLVFGLIMIYPYFAIKSYYGLKRYQGLNGIKYLESFYPEDYQAILWLKQNIKNQPYILEAEGESYSDFARVSANTGLPVLVGWPVHEWLWRGGYDEVGKRREMTRRIYETTDFLEAKRLLSQYNLVYVFIGDLERRQYPELNEEKFNSLGRIVFQQGETKIYKIKD